MIGIIASSATRGIPLDVLLADGNTFADWDFINSVTKDGNNRISSATDLAANTNHLTNATQNEQPIWSLDNGATFDGSDDSLVTPLFTINQPNIIYSVIKVISFTKIQILYNGLSGTDGQELAQIYPANNASLYSGVYLTGAALPVGEWKIVKTYANTTNSFVQVNDTVVTGNAGTSPLGGFLLGKWRGGTQYNANIAVKRIFIRTSLNNDADIYAALKNEYNI